MMTSAIERVAQRLYEWSLCEAVREAEGKFPLAKLVKGKNAERYVRFFHNVPSADVPIAAQAIVKRMNLPWLLRQQATLTDEEQKYVQAYLRFEEISGPGGTRIVGTRPATPCEWASGYASVGQDWVSD
jgi:hypothetical protein